MIKNDEKLYRLAIKARDKLYNIKLDNEENRKLYFIVNEMLEYILK